LSATEVAAVIAAGAAVAGVVVLAVLLTRINRTVRDVGESVQLLRFPSLPIDATAELEPADERRARDAGELVARLARANPVLDVSQPVIKVLALASGTGRAARQLRRARAKG